MITVMIVGGPNDGIEVEVEEGRNRVHMAIPGEPQGWMQLSEGNVSEETGVSITEAIMPVRLTDHGYRAYWAERA